MPTSEQAMLADTFPPAKRPQAFALYGIAVIVAPTVGPTLGGWITDNYSWHWIFFINVPIGFVSLALVHWLVEEPEILQRERRARLARGLNIDWLGILLIALTFGCLEIVLDRGEIDGWFGSTTIVTFAAAAAGSLILLVAWELTRRDPVVNLGLLFQRQFGLAFIVMLVVGAILFGSNQITPQLLQTNFPYTAELSGLAMMPGGFAMLLMMPIAGQVTGLMQPKYWMALGFAMIAGAMWYSTSLSPDANFGFFVKIRILQTLGLPFLFLPINVVAYSELPSSETNQGSALVNVARNLGGSVGVSLANTELLQRTQFHQARLVSNLFPSSLAYEFTLSQVTKHFATTGSPAEAATRAIHYIGALVASQAQILAYIDVFYTWALFSAALVPIVLLLVRRTEHDASGPAGMH